jgi:IPT/TIG domain
MHKLGFTFVFLLLIFWSCTLEENAPVLVSTEEVLFVGGDKIRLSGRLLTNREVLAKDHGFIFSTTSSFASPITLSLGEKNGPGRFIGEKGGFIIGQTYFVKAFAEVEGQRLEGEVVELKTLSPAVNSFSPSYGVAGGEVVIQGKNFPQGTKVFFGTQEAQVLQNLFESKLTVKIPAPTGQVVVPIKLIVQNKEIVLPTPFEYQAGKFTKVSEFPGGLRIYDNAFFFNETGFYVGLGKIKLGDYYPNFQRFQPSTGTWSEVSFPGAARRFAFASPNYLGGGAIETSRDVYQFDRSFWKINGNSFERLTDLPFTSREALAVEWEGKLVLLGGLDGAGQLVRSYDPQLKSWTNKRNAPVALGKSGAALVWNARIIVLASNGQVWDYNPSLDSWQLLTTYPGNKGQGYPIAQVIGKKAYFGLFRATQELWELNLETLVWKTKNQIIGLPQSINVGHFTFNGSIYFLRAPEESVSTTLPLELYKFDPDAI